jgi:Ca-activated chloride channel family protein
MDVHDRSTSAKDSGVLLTMRVLVLVLATLFAPVLALGALTGCRNPANRGTGGTGDPQPATTTTQQSSTSASTSASTASAAPAGEVVLEVLFSSEKKDWAGEAFSAFNANHVTLADGRRVRVHATFGGSIEPIEGIVAGTTRPHVFSPASSLVLPLLQDQWMGAKGATEKPIVGTGDPLVLSPVVIAMWEPMARVLGWPAKKLGWSDIAALARSPEGWRAKGHPEWGDFRFGHTHPEYSNSGLIAVLAEVYAGVGKTRDLADSDPTAARTKKFLSDIESAVVHYGRSTGFFYDALAHYGPAYLSAAVLYENLVVASSQGTQAENLPFPLVCIYPREGTQWADHPYAVLDAPWVGPSEREAATKLKEYLLSRPVQERAMTRYGFRPALVDVPVGAPIDAAHGADPKEPQTLLGLPNVRLVRTVLQAWKETKRGVDVVVVFDRSGSMGGPRLTAAREGLIAFLQTLRPTDRVVLLTFNGQLDPPTPPAAPAELVPRVQGLFASGETALYDAILRGRDLAEESTKTDKTHIHAVVVLTDGEDNRSQTKLPELTAKLTPAEQGGGVRIFTIGYGKEASDRILKDVAARTGGAYYHGDVDNIRAVYDEIGSFF